MAKPNRGKQRRGFYPSLGEHLHTADVDIRRLAEHSGVAQASIRRMLRGDVPALATTVERIVTSLNELHFAGTGKPLTVDDALMEIEHV